MSKFTEDTTDLVAAIHAGDRKALARIVAIDVLVLASQWAAEEGLDPDPDLLEAEADRLAGKLASDIMAATKGLPADEADELAYDRIVEAAESIDLHDLPED